jgi:hypothetical protein
MVDGKRIPTRETYNNALRDRESQKSQGHYISKAGIQHVKLGIELLSDTNLCLTYVNRTYNQAGSNLSLEETRKWDTLKRDQRTQGKAPNYTIDGEGRLCYQEKLLCGWEEFHDKIVEVLMSLPRNTSAKTLTKKVQEKYAIKQSAIRLFCDHCNAWNAHGGGETNVQNGGAVLPYASTGSNEIPPTELAFGGGGDGGGANTTTINPWVPLAFGGGGGGDGVINPFTFFPSGVGVGGQTINPFNLPSFGGTGPVFQNTTNNTNTDNRDYSQHTHDNSQHTHTHTHTHTQKIDSSIVEKIDSLVAGHHLLVAGQQEHGTMLHAIQLQTERRPVPSSALREKREKQAKEMGATSLFHNFDDMAAEDGMHTDPYTQSDSDDSAVSVDGEDNINLMTKSFNLMHGNYVQTDGFVLDRNIVSAEEEDLRRIEVSAKEEEEARKSKFSPEKDETPRENSGTIIADWAGTLIKDHLAKAETEEWKCQQCKIFVSNKLTECPCCAHSYGVNASAGGIGTGSSSGNIPFSFGIPVQSTAAKAPSEHFAFGNAPAPASLETFGSSATMGSSFPMTFGTSKSSDAGALPFGIPPSSSGFSASGPTFGATSPGGSFGLGGFNAPSPLN